MLVHPHWKPPPETRTRSPTRKDWVLAVKNHGLLLTVSNPVQATEICAVVPVEFGRVMPLPPGQSCAWQFGRMLSSRAIDDAGATKSAYQDPAPSAVM
jgi:hypothetical protein